MTPLDPKHKDPRGTTVFEQGSAPLIGREAQPPAGTGRAPSATTSAPDDGQHSLTPEAGIAFSMPSPAASSWKETRGTTGHSEMTWSTSCIESAQPWDLYGTASPRQHSGKLSPATTSSRTCGSWHNQAPGLGSWNYWRWEDSLNAQFWYCERIALPCCSERSHHPPCAEASRFGFTMNTSSGSSRPSPHTSGPPHEQLTHSTRHGTQQPLGTPRHTFPTGEELTPPSPGEAARLTTSQSLRPRAPAATCTAGELWQAPHRHGPHPLT